MHSLDPLTLAALLDLLLDDSPKVVQAAREKLASFGEAGERALAHAAQSDDARLRVRARAALLVIRQERAMAEALEYAARPDLELDLEEAALRLSRIEYPDFDRTPYVAILDSLGEQLASRVRGERERVAPAAAAAELARLLATEQRLRMNDEEYDDPDNSFLHRVLERRRGIPISLAAIYLIVAKRAELPLFGIGAPGHYLLRYGGADLDLFLDPATGRRMTLDTAMRMLAIRGLPVSAERFAPATTRETLVRMCANLVSVYDRRQMAAPLARWTLLRDAYRDRARAARAPGDDPKEG
jgi:regulator of sirC expression with transglutaminase-like and TPR domain